MALTTRREFVQQTAFAAAALYGCPVEALAEAQRMFETREQKTASFDSAAIRKLASEITGHVITPDASDYDGQGHLNNASTVRLFNDMRVAYVRHVLDPWWSERIRSAGFVIAAREVHVLYESEGFPGEHYAGGMKYVRREGKAALLEQRIVEATAARAVARAWVVQLLVQEGAVVDWPDEYFVRVEAAEGRAIERRPRRADIGFGPPE